MCPAIHINSRSWLRSSSTHEPSDPPPKVVFVSVFFCIERNEKRAPHAEACERAALLPQGVTQSKSAKKKVTKKKARGGHRSRSRDSLNLRPASTVHDGTTRADPALAELSLPKCRRLPSSAVKSCRPEINCLAFHGNPTARQDRYPQVTVWRMAGRPNKPAHWRTRPS